ncbi:hypothetical protein DFH27DRAFT_648663 [Peziza echinospora]|nr:hypothetical protein DFH27DRAFT_648663 [Peziza echinospora]
MEFVYTFLTNISTLLPIEGWIVATLLLLPTCSVLGGLLLWKSRRATHSRNNESVTLRRRGQGRWWTCPTCTRVGYLGHRSTEEIPSWRGRGRGRGRGRSTTTYRRICQGCCSSRRGSAVGHSTRTEEQGTQTVQDTTPRKGFPEFEPMGVIEDIDIDVTTSTGQEAHLVPLAPVQPINDPVLLDTASTERPFSAHGPILEGLQTQLNELYDAVFGPLNGNGSNANGNGDGNDNTYHARTTSPDTRLSSPGQPDKEYNHMHHTLNLPTIPPLGLDPLSAAPQAFHCRQPILPLDPLSPAPPSQYRQPIFPFNPAFPHPTTRYTREYPGPGPWAPPSFDHYGVFSFTSAEIREWNACPDTKSDQHLAVDVTGSIVGSIDEYNSRTIAFRAYMAQKGQDIEKWMGMVWEGEGPPETPVSVWGEDEDEGERPKDAVKPGREGEITYDYNYTEGEDPLVRTEHERRMMKEYRESCEEEYKEWFEMAERRREEQALRRAFGTSEEKDREDRLSSVREGLVDLHVEHQFMASRSEASSVGCASERPRSDSGEYNW